MWIPSTVEQELQETLEKMAKTLEPLDLPADVLLWVHQNIELWFQQKAAVAEAKRLFMRF